MDNRVFMFHEEESPEGRIFNIATKADAEKLEAEGWVDTPAKFGQEKPKPAKKSGTDADPIDSMKVDELDAYIKARGGEPAGKRPEKVALAKSLPKDPIQKEAQKPDNAGGGVDLIEDMSDDDLKAELDLAEVEYAADAPRENLIAAVKALREV